MQMYCLDATTWYYKTGITVDLLNFEKSNMASVKVHIKWVSDI